MIALVIKESASSILHKSGNATAHNYLPIAAYNTLLIGYLPYLKASLTDHKDWYRRIRAATERHHIAKWRAAESIIERLALSEADGSIAHSEAAQAELQALREYLGLLEEYLVLWNTEKNRISFNSDFYHDL